MINNGLFLQKIILKFGIFLFLTFFIALPSLANNSKYLITDIIVSEESNSASKARELANINANRQAFIRLLKKLSVNESFASNIDDEQLEESIQAKTVSNEKIANNWYKASFNIEFSKDYIDHLLESKDGGNFINLEANKKYLIFPIEIKNKEPKLWHKNNKWFNAWRSLLSAKELKNIKIAAGDIDDISILKSTNPIKAKYTDVKDILKKYDSKIAVFIDIYLDHLENNATINIVMVKQFTKKKIKLSFVNINDIKEDRLYNIIAQKIIEYLDQKDLSSNNNKEYKKKKDSKNIDVDILPSSLKDWVIFRRKLEKIKEIEFKIISISADLIKLTIKPKAEMDLIEYLQDNGVFIERGKGSEQVYYVVLE